VDGLLGIGVAGGGTSSNEGAMLAARLAEMRRERDARAKIRPTAPVMAAAAAPPTKTPIAQMLQPPQKPNRPKSKKKKTKK
jgi:hypothetical protein